MVLENLEKVDSNNKSGEFYLTDVFQDGANVDALCFEDESPFHGVSPVQLRSALHQLKIRINRAHQARGVLVMDAPHTYIEPSVEIEPGANYFSQLLPSRKDQDFEWNYCRNWLCD